MRFKHFFIIFFVTLNEHVTVYFVYSLLLAYLYYLLVKASTFQVRTTIKTEAILTK